MNESTTDDFLYQDFLEELNYKIWSTKECRFNAKSRLLKLSHAANHCRKILLTYFITVVILGVFNLFYQNLFDQYHLMGSIILLLMLLLILSQIENKKNYLSKAEEFHSCGLELSSLYNVILLFKYIVDNQTIENKKEFTHKLAESYQKIIEIHINHAPIDTDLFKLKDLKYHNLNWLDVQIIKINYYLRTLLFFHFLIILPPILLFIAIKR